MKKLILLLNCSLNVFISTAQRVLPPPGKVTQEEILLQSCSFDPGANACKLFDTQEIEIENDGESFWLETRKRVRIKIFNEKGYPHASVEIPYYNIERSTRIEDLQGYIYTPEGNGKTLTTKLEKQDFYKDVNRNNLNRIRFTFPSLKPGSIIEFSYRKIEKNILEIDPWIIQDEIPVDYAFCKIEIPGYSGLSEKITGTDAIETTDEKVFFGQHGKIRKTYQKERIPAFRIEPFMSAVNDNLIRLLFHYRVFINPAEPEKNEPDYQWAVFGSRFLTILNTELDLKRDIPGTDDIINTARIINPVKDRINFLFGTIKKQFPGVRSPELYPEDIRKTWMSREGNSADINLVLLNLLRKSGIEAYPLLVSTREHGKINTQFPGPGQLNGLDILVHVGDEYYVMDATQHSTNPFIPPANVLNRKGLLLKKNSYKWLDILDNRTLSKQHAWVTGVLDLEGNIKGVARISYFDYAKMQVADSSTITTEKNKAIYKFGPGIIADSIRYEQTSNFEEPVTEQMNYRIALNNSGNYYFLNPQLFSQQAENPFKAGTRITDIDFGSKHESILQLNIELPESVIPDFLLTNLIIRAPDSSFLFRRSVKFSNGLLSYYQKFEISQPVFYKEDYPGVKEFFDRVYALMAEEIVLKKK